MKLKIGKVSKLYFVIYNSRVFKEFGISKEDCLTNRQSEDAR